MSTSNVYGRFPGVRVSVTGGGISNAQIGREQKLVLFGRGDVESGSASANDPVQIRSRAEAAEAFGDGTPLADGIEEALANKGTFDYIYGVAPEQTDVVAETVAGGSGNLENYPIVENETVTTATDVTAGTEATVEFRYESPPETPQDDDTVFINPLTGEVEADDSNDHEIDYSYLDWGTVIDAADNVLNHAEVGIYCPMIDSEDVALTLSHKVSGDPDTDDDLGLRGEYKLVIGLAGAQPNATNSDGEPVIDTGNYSDAIDDDAMFLAGPVRRSGDDSNRTVLPGIAGRFAGNAMQNPIYGDPVLGYDQLSQALTRDDGDAMRDHQTIPVVDDYRDGGEGITMQGHHSTSTATDWNRTFQNRRLTDIVILMQRRIGEAARDNLMRDQQLDEIESQIINGFERLAREGLIHGDPDGENQEGDSGLLSDIGTDVQQVGDDSNPYFAEAVRSDVNTIAVGSGFTPVGVTTAVDAQITVSDSVGAFEGGDS